MVFKQLQGWQTQQSGTARLYYGECAADLYSAARATFHTAHGPMLDGIEPSQIQRG